MKLPIAPEPGKLVREAQQYRQRQKYPEMDYDTFYIWLVKKKNLPSYLWTKCKWKEVLKKEGIQWQKFLKILSRVPLKQWLRNQRTWDEMVNGIRERIEKNSGQ